MHELIKKATEVKVSYGHGAFGEGERYEDLVIDPRKLIQVVALECLNLLNDQLADQRFHDIQSRSAIHESKERIRKRFNLR